MDNPNGETRVGVAACSKDNLVALRRPVAEPVPADLQSSGSDLLESGSVGVDDEEADWAVLVEAAKLKPVAVRGVAARLVFTSGDRGHSGDPETIRGSDGVETGTL